MKVIHFDLNFVHSEWVIRNKEIIFKSESFEELDKMIEDYLKQKFKSGFFKVKLYFDFQDFPIWMRQYMPHYFNREIIVKL